MCYREEMSLKGIVQQQRKQDEKQNKTTAKLKFEMQYCNEVSDFELTSDEDEWFISDEYRKLKIFSNYFSFSYFYYVFWIG